MADIIYRAAAIEALGAEPEVWNDDDDYQLGLYNQWSDDVNAIEDVPSAERRGKWEVTKSEAHSIARCSVCKSEFYYFNKGQYHIDVSRYCPNCGAKMNEVEE